MWAAARRLCGPGAGVLRLRGCGEAALPPAGARNLHGSAVSCGSKNLLKKFASKTRKKFWYEGPSLGSDLTYRPSKLDLLLRRTSKRTRKEEHVRLRALNGLLYKALTDLLSSPEVSQEVYDLNVEVSKVSLSPDRSACRVYWKVDPSADRSERTEAALQRSAAHMRHLLMAQQTLRNVPPIVFIQDRKNAALAEIDRLLAVADFGPADEGDYPTRDARDLDALSPRDPPGPAAHSSLCGIDHEALNKQIMEYKRRKEKGLPSPALLGREQGAEPTQLVRRRRKALPCQDQDSSPRSFLLSEDEDEDTDKNSTLGCECPAQEAEQEWEADPGDQGHSRAPVAEQGRGRVRVQAVTMPVGREQD